MHDTLLKWLASKEHKDRFDKTLGFRTFLNKYAEEWKSNKRRKKDVDKDGADAEAFKDMVEFGPNEWEWRRELVPEGQAPVELLCCPEDVQQCDRKHGPEKICGKCKVPICLHCYQLMDKGQIRQLAPYFF